MESKILFLCYENQCVIYLDIKNNVKKIMDIEDIDNYNFYMLYEWNGENIILSTYENNFLELNIREGSLKILDPDCNNAYKIRQDYYKLRK